MKLRVSIFAMVFLLVISALHVQLNVGWDTLAEEWQGLFDPQRRTLIVGYLPVT